MRVVFGVASIPTREKELGKTIATVLHQADIIHVFLNGYGQHTPSYLQHDKIMVYRSEVYGDKGDAGKFFNVPEDCYYFSIDDDLLYPATYAKDMIAELEKYSGRIIVTHHGRILKPFPIRNYYKDKLKVHRCLRAEKEQLLVDVGGSGVMAFDTRYFRPKYEWFELANMADIWIAKYAQIQKMPILALPHSANYFGYQVVRDTICEKHQNHCIPQTKIVNSIKWNRYQLV